MHFSRRWFLLLLLLLLAACQAQGNFNSNLSTPQTANVMARKPLEVTFNDLQANPADYLNRFIRVRGKYFPLEQAPCQQIRGPLPQWTMEDQSLAMQARGLQRVMQLVPIGTTIAVEGFWRYHEGPIGCGKEPISDIVWYLEVVRIVEPNPLPQLLAGDPSQGESPRVEEPVTPGATTTGESTVVDGEPLATPTRPTIPTATMTPTPDERATRTPTPTEEPTATRDRSTTPEPGDPTPTPTGTPTPEPTDDGGGGSTPTPPPTNTPSDPGYPGPPPDPTDEPPSY